MNNRKFNFNITTKILKIFALLILFFFCTCADKTSKNDDGKKKGGVSEQEIETTSGSEIIQNTEETISKSEDSIDTSSKQVFDAARWSINKTWVVYDPAPIYAEMKRLLQTATKSIRFDFYIFYGPDAEEMADIMIEKSKTGVDVKIMLDPTFGPPGSAAANAKAIFERLKKNKSDSLSAYISPVHLMSQQFRNINHNKNFILDDKIMVTGGMNVGVHFEKYHDLMVFAEGTVAKNLGVLFDRDFKLAQKEAEKPSEKRMGVYLTPPLPYELLLNDLKKNLSDSEQSVLRLVTNGFGRNDGYVTILQRIRDAKKEIDLQMSEFSGMEFAYALVAAKNRGVKVRALIDADDNIADFVPYLGESLAGFINARTLGILLQNGIETRFFEQDDKYTRAHLKLAVFDRELVSVGTTNWNTDILGNCETNFEMYGGNAAKVLKENFEKEWVNAPSARESSSTAILLNSKAYSAGFFRDIPQIPLTEEYWKHAANWK